MDQPYDHHQLWYSHLHAPIEGVKETWFYDGKLPFTRMIEENYGAIREEVMNALRNGQAQLDAALNNRLATAENTWQSFSFFFWGHVVSEYNCGLCPFTLDLLRRIPGCVSASVSVLQGQSSIKPHRGNTNAIYRCHLPLQVPAGLPQVGFHVGYEERPWEEGKLMVFNDAAYHKAWNNTDLPRTVLIFDVIRPLFLPREKEICAEVLRSFQ